jgi:hypothetical protein
MGVITLLCLNLKKTANGLFISFNNNFFKKKKKKKNFIIVYVLYVLILKLKFKYRFKFDDDRVTPVMDKEVLEDNYGGEYQNANTITIRSTGRNHKRFTNAYMLVYIRESNVDEILSPVVPDDIPEHLRMYMFLYFKLIRLKGIVIHLLLFNRETFGTRKSS